ncbi:MAG: hypothetical protein IJU77_06410 [Butyrivibrio sp.]|nr:hypothetical protein [Butyrivibrio sp.]
MLTISAPLEIKAKTTYLRDPEAFYHRIVGGYSLMETTINQEDLLHITATPPEIYVAEGEGMTSILSRSERNETNINKVEILNNVMNRIISSADFNLTYQDRVFITDALYKLGIKDDRRFMEAFYQMTLETRNTNALIDLYIENGENLKEMVESVESMYYSTIRDKSLLTEKERENYLYSSVMNRLKTGAVYQIVSNFNRTVEDNSIDAREYSISNQSYTAQHMLLSILRKQAGLPDENLVFYGGNTYEESVENEDVQIKDIKNEITAAVLLDMLQNIYHTGFDRFYNNSETYYRFEDMFYKSADQTFLRLLNNAQTEYFESINNQAFINESRNLIRNEIELLEKGEQGTLSEEELIRITDYLSTMNIRDEERRQSILSLQDRKKEIISLLTEERRVDDFRTELLKLREEGTLSEEEIERITDYLTSTNISDVRKEVNITNLTDREREIISLLTETNRLSQADVELTRLKEEGRVTQQEINRITDFLTSSYIRDVRKDVNIISLSDREREIIGLLTETNRLSETSIQLSHLKEEGRVTEEEIKRITDYLSSTNTRDEKREVSYFTLNEKEREIVNLITRREELSETKRELLENIRDRQLTSQEISRLYETARNITSETERIERELTRQTDRQRQSIENITLTERDKENIIEHRQDSETTHYTDEELRSINETVNKINIENEKRRQHYVQEISKIREKQVVKEPKVGLKRTIEDAALALSNPEKLMEQLEVRRERRIVRQNNIVNELKNIFPDQSIEIYQMLNNLNEGDVNLIENNIVRPADVGELMHDINTVTERTFVEKREPERKDREVEEFIESIKAARAEEEFARDKALDRRPVETVHRRSENITAEELSEQLDLIQKNFKTQVNKNVETQVVTTDKTEHVTEIRTNESRVEHITARDVQQMIDSGMKKQMQTISNQVLGKIERQMKNEKMRRGY